jgi:hypothetical protein
MGLSRSTVTPRLRRHRDRQLATPLKRRDGHARAAADAGAGQGQDTSTSKSGQRERQRTVQAGHSTTTDSEAV